MAHFNDPGRSMATPDPNPFVNESSSDVNPANLIESTRGGVGHEPKDPGMEAPPDDISYPEDRLGVSADTFTPIGDRIITLEKHKWYLARHLVSGSYIGSQASWRIELRVDIDRPGALNMVSFDFFQVGSSTTYWGSFRMNSPVIQYTSTQATIEGALTGTRSMWANRARIVIQRNLIVQPAASAIITLMQNNSAGASYTCNFQSRYFRTVLLETDVENGTTLFGSYNTGTFTNPGPTRTLNVVSAFQEAGVDMVYTGSNNTINTSEAGGDSKWTETEMHASMVRHFSVFRNLPQWAVWCFAARRATSSTLLGIMFDYLSSNKPHRQGCAIFQDTLANYHSGSDYTRNQLYTYVHEIGHAFNLLHSWDKSRPDSLSWMNYPWKYDQRNGSGRFWANFTFGFDRDELIHLRHGYYNNVIMGGNDWAVGAGLEAPHSHADDFALEISDDQTGLKLELEPVKKSFVLGEPVVVEIKLRTKDKDGRVVNANIHPKYEQVRVGIMKPDGRVVAYEPVGHNCMAEKVEKLDENKETIYASAYIGYGKHGFYFDVPGIYKLKAAYRTQDGSLIQSAEVKIRVKSPLNATEDAIADAYFHDDVGMLFYLLGSDSPSLQNGNDLLKEVSSKYAKNPLSVYADFILGSNEAMTFKIVDPETNGLIVRKRDVQGASAHLEKVFAESAGAGGIDNITLNWAYRQLADGMLKEGNDKGAKDLLKKMEATFKAKKLKPAVIAFIKKQIESLLKNR
ncbi:MAG: hypothetical protein MUE99_01680 [Chitinophagaceae bacterium]|nr:hypothetical protein [Chitinophagaceae bacterium]